MEWIDKNEGTRVEKQGQSLEEGCISQRKRSRKREILIRKTGRGLGKAVSST